MAQIPNAASPPTAPGNLGNRGAVGAADQVRLLGALYGLRVEIPRWQRRPVPLAQDIMAGYIDGRKRKGPLAAPKYPAGTEPPGTVPPGTVPPGVEPPPYVEPGPSPGPGPGPGPVPSGESLVSPRTFNFHFGVSSGGSETIEVRVSPRMAQSFRIKELSIVPIAGVMSGQYLDVLIAPDGDLSDAGSTVGNSVFESLPFTSALSSLDRPSGLHVPSQTIVRRDVGPLFAGGQVIKVVLRLTTTAAVMPQVSVTITVHEGADLQLIPEPRVLPRDLPPSVTAPPSAVPGGGVVEEPPVSWSPPPFAPPVAAALPSRVYFPPAPVTQTVSYSTGGVSYTMANPAVSGLVTTVTQAEIAAGRAARSGQVYTLTLTPNGYQAVLVAPLPAGV